MTLPKQLKTVPIRSLVRRLARELPASHWYLVGGSVRDAFLKKELKDYDLVVTKTPLVKLQRVLKQHGTVQLVGRRFGVLKFNPRGTVRGLKGKEIDIALPRTDHYGQLTGKHRDVSVQTDPDLPIEDDLSRRDFTVNAMAYDVLHNMLIDPFNGQRDVQKKVIRAVGDPNRRFREDTTRVLRAIRFALVVQGTIEPATLAAVKRHMSKLKQKTVAMEVVAAELAKSFSISPGNAFDLMARTGVFVTLMPEVEALRGVEQPKAFHKEGDVWNHTRIALKLLETAAFRRTFPQVPITAQLAFTVLLHDIGKPPTTKTPKQDGVDRVRSDGHPEVGAEMARKIATRLKLSSSGMVDVDDMVWAIRHHLIGLPHTLDHIKETTFAKYFLHPEKPGELLTQLIWADGGATVPWGKTAKRGSYTRIRQRLTRLQKKMKQRSLPSPLLNGNDVMTLLNIPAGPEVGKVLEALQEEQLTGKVKTRKKAEGFVKALHPK